MKCVNKRHPEFIKLSKQSAFHPELLAAKISIWQDQNNTDEFPTLNQVDDNIQYQNLSPTNSFDRMASEQTIRDLSAKLAARIGIPFNIEADRTKEYKGKIERGIPYINLAYATLDTPIHEILGHPIIRVIKGEERVAGNPDETDHLESIGYVYSHHNAENYPVYTSGNKQLYQNLLKELDYGIGKEVLDRIKSDYIYKSKPGLDLNLPEVNEYGVSLQAFIKASISVGHTLDEVIEDIKKNFTGSDGEWLYFNRTPSEPEFYGDELTIQTTFQEVYNKVNGGKSDQKYTLADQQEEAIVDLLGLMTADKLDAVKDGKLISLLKRLLKEMKTFIRSLLSQREIEIDKLPDNMTIGDIANVLAYSNSKLILPGYKVQYTTPDNENFKTYQEASNHISELAKNVKDVDLDDIKIIEYKDKNEYLYGGWRYFKKDGKDFIESVNFESIIEPDKYISVLNVPNLMVNGQMTTQDWEYTKEQYEKFAKDNNYIIKYDIREKEGSFDRYQGLNSSIYSIKNFIVKNKEYEQSKEIIEEWKKVNNIIYDPAEVYSRDQIFSSVVGAYSSFDVKLMMQNLLSHIEDNEKAGGKFAISAYTKPINKTLGHLDGGGGKIKFIIYPKSEDILWAAATDVYSGSVWDAADKISTKKKSELLGVSYTKYPSIRNVQKIKPNLAAVIDELTHHHNELGITLTGNNFRLEYDDNIPFATKKIINSINAILDQKYGKIVKPKLDTGDTINYKVVDIDGSDPFAPTEWLFNTHKEADDFIKNKAPHLHKWFEIHEVKQGIQPRQTKDTLKQSIGSIQTNLDKRSDVLPDKFVVKGKDKGYSKDTWWYKENGEWYMKHVPYDSPIDTKVQPYDITNINTVGLSIDEVWESYLGTDPVLTSTSQTKTYTSQALINTKIAALKSVAKKYPRSLIRSEVIPSNTYDTPNYFSDDELPFSKISNTITTTINNQAINEGATNNRFSSNKKAKAFANKINTRYQDNMISAVGNTIQFNEGVANQLSIEPDAYPEQKPLQETIPEIKFSSDEEVNNLFEEINFNLSPDFKEDLNVKKWFNEWAQKNQISFKHYGQLKNKPAAMMQGTAQAMRYRRLILFADEAVGWRTMTEEAIHMGLYALWQTDPILQTIKDRKILNLSPNYDKVYKEYFEAYTKREQQIAAKIHDIELLVLNNKGVPVMVPDAIYYVADPNDPLIEEEKTGPLHSTDYLNKLQAFLSHLSKNKGDLIMMEVLAKLMAHQVRDEVTEVYGKRADRAINRIWNYFKEKLTQLWHYMTKDSSAEDKKMLRDWIRKVSASVVKSEIDLSHIHENPPQGYLMMHTRPNIGKRASEGSFTELLRNLGVHKAMLNKYTLQLEKYHINHNVPMDKLVTMDGVYALTSAKATAALLDLTAKARVYTVNALGVQNFNYTFISRAAETISYINHMATLAAGPYDQGQQNMLSHLLAEAIDAETAYLTGMSDPNTRTNYIAVLKEEGKNYYDYKQFETDHGLKLQEAATLKAAYEASDNDQAILDQLDAAMNELELYDATYENLGIRAHQGKQLTRLKAIEERISKFKKEIRDKSFGNAVLWFVLGSDVNAPKGATSDYTNMLTEAREIFDNTILEMAEISHVVNGTTVYKPMVGDSNNGYADTNPHALFDKFKYEKWAYYQQYIDFNETVVAELRALLADPGSLDLPKAQRDTLHDAINGYTDVNGVPVMGLTGYIDHIKAYVTSRPVKNLAAADFLFKYSTDKELNHLRKAGESDLEFIIRKKIKVNELIDRVYEDQGTLSKVGLNPTTNQDAVLNAAWLEVTKVEQLIAKLKSDSTQAYYKESSRLADKLDYNKLQQLVGSGPEAIVFSRIQNLLIEHEEGKTTSFLLNKYHQAKFDRAKRENKTKLKNDTEEALSNWGYINYNQILQLAKYNPNHSMHKDAIDAMLDQIKPILLKYGISSAADVSGIWEQIDKAQVEKPYLEIKALIQQSSIIDDIVKEHNEYTAVLDATDPYTRSTVDFMYSGEYKESDETLSMFLKVLKIDNRGRFNASHTQSEYIEDSDEELDLAAKTYQDILTANGDTLAAPSQKSISEIKAWKANRDKKHIRNLIAWQRSALTPLEFKEWQNKNIETKYKKSAVGGNHTVILRAKGDLRIPSLNTGDTSYVRKKVDYRVNDETGEFIPEFEKVALTKTSYKNENYDKLLSNPEFKEYYAHHKAHYVEALKRVYKGTSFLERIPISATAGEALNVGNKIHRVGFQPAAFGRSVQDKFMKLVFAFQDMFQFNSDDTFAGSGIEGYADSIAKDGPGRKSLRKIGTHYLTPLNDPRKYTEDIEMSLALFAEMTIEHQVWGKNFARINAIEEVIANRQYTAQSARKRVLNTIRVDHNNSYYDSMDTIRGSVKPEYSSNSYNLFKKKLNLAMGSSTYADLNQDTNKWLLAGAKLLNKVKGYVHLMTLAFHWPSQLLALSSTLVNMSRLPASDHGATGKRNLVRQLVVDPVLRFRFIKSALDNESRDAIRHLADMAGLYKYEMNRGNFKALQLIGKIPMAGFDITANINSGIAVARNVFTYKYRRDKNGVFKWMSPQEHSLELAELKKEYLTLPDGPAKDALKADLDLRYKDTYLEAGIKKNYTYLKEVYIYNKKSKQPFAIRSDWKDRFTDSDLAKFLTIVNYQANTAEDQPSSIAFNDINTNIFAKAALTLFNWLLVMIPERIKTRDYDSRLGYNTSGDINEVYRLSKKIVFGGHPIETMVNVMQLQSTDPTARRGVLGLAHTAVATWMLFQMFNALSRWCDEDSWLCNLLRIVSFRTAMETGAKGSIISFAQQIQVQMVMLDMMKDMITAADMAHQYLLDDPEATADVTRGPYLLKPKDQTFIPFKFVEDYVRDGVSNTTAKIISVTPANNLARFAINKKTLNALGKTYQTKSRYANEDIWAPTFLADLINSNKSKLEEKRDKALKAIEKAQEKKHKK